MNKVITGINEKSIKLREEKNKPEETENEASN